MPETWLEELQRLAGFDASAQALLHAFQASIASELPVLAQALHVRLQPHDVQPDALCRWLSDLLAERCDGAYFALDLAIPASGLVGLLSAVRAGLSALAETAPEPAPLLRALHKRLDLELALCFEARERAERPTAPIALDTMAASLAHEIRNPLNAAHLQLAVAQRRVRVLEADTAAALTALEIADRELMRLDTCVSEFLHGVLQHDVSVQRKLT